MATKTTISSPTTKKVDAPTLIVTATGTVRWDHKSCKHEHSGAEGKKARAHCRKEHEAEFKKAQAAQVKKLERVSAKATTAKPAPRAPRAAAPKPAPAPAPVTAVEDLTVDA